MPREILVIQDFFFQHRFYVSSFTSDNILDMYEVDLKRMRCGCRGWLTIKPEKKTVDRFIRHKHVKIVLKVKKLKGI